MEHYVQFPGLLCLCSANGLLGLGYLPLGVDFTGTQADEQQKASDYLGLKCMRCPMVSTPYLS